jgi:hypothetical protein
MAVAFTVARRPGGLERTVGWGLAIVIASVGAEAPSRGLAACASIGDLVCVGGACYALSRIPSEGGLIASPRMSSKAPVAFVAAVWWAAVVANLAPSRRALLGAVEHPRAWSWAALIASGAALVVCNEWTRRRRALELGVVERAAAIRSSLVLLFVAGLLVAVLARTETDSLAMVVLALGAALVAAAATHPDPVRVAQVARRSGVLAIYGGSVALLGASAADGSDSAWTATIVTAVACIVLGAAAAGLEAPLRPMHGVWLDAFERAATEALRPDPDDAVREVLLALRATSGLEHPSPELWSFAPSKVTTVDAAGYLHGHEVELPEMLPVLAAGEPEATLRAEVLDAFQVRRADLRALARWMDARGALVATVLACEGETEGLLVLPRGSRGERLTLEEVRALKNVTDRLARACRARAEQARMLERVRAASQRIEEAEQLVERLEHERALATHRDVLAAVRLARPAIVGVYSVSSRAALEALERRTSVDGPLAIVAPSGVDPIPYLARAHLAGARKDRSFVLVEATSAREHDVARWCDRRASPLALAHRGMLVLVDGASLPLDVQRLVARACAEKRPPWEASDPLDVQLAFTGVAPPDDLEASGRLDAALALRLGDARSSPVVLPRLCERSEDFRAIVTDRLAREGLRVIGRPVGIDHGAYARLVEYGFPGEDTELAAIVIRLVARCSGDVVRAADVDALNLPTSAADESDRRKDPLTA